MKENNCVHRPNSYSIYIIYEKKYMYTEELRIGVNVGVHSIYVLSMCKH